MFIGEYLKERRLKEGKHQVDYAKLFEISTVYYAQLENGKAQPSWEMLNIIAKKLEVSFPVILLASFSDKHFLVSKRKIFRENKHIIAELIEKLS